ncbi:MAG: peptidase, zinc-dependent [Bacteroidetes bacterium]|nr:peptidase, zinc-dependent [Bacteroidota bacterium]
MNGVTVVALGRIEETVLEAVTTVLGHTFQIPVRTAPALPEPVFAYDQQRGQYGSVLVLRHILKERAEPASKVLGVTEKDLFIPMLSFVLGQAQLSGPAAVISLARLRQEFYGFAADGDLLITRAMKEAVHEIGHTFGLTHCTDNRCPMSLSNTVQHVDIKGTDLCATCATLFEEKRRQYPTSNNRSSAAG